MPTYEYQCTSCDKKFDHVQRMSEDALTQCLCEKKGNVHRIITTTNFSLKGSGWYVTDFRGGSTGRATQASNDSTPSSTVPTPTSPAAAASTATPAPATPAPSTAP